MASVLITGAAGFVGSHMTRHMISMGHRVFGLDSCQPGPVMDGVCRYCADICDRRRVESVVLEIRPDVIFHFAGVLKAFDVQDFYRVHVLGTVALLESVIKLGFTPRVFIASSSAVYGSSADGVAFTEQSPLCPETHYAVSKAAQELVSARYYGALGFPVIIARSFNLIGPGQPAELACSSFARQIATAECLGESGSIAVGNLGARRDFVDVRDAVRAYDMLFQRGQPGSTYNVCSGRSVKIRDCLDILLGRARVPLAVRTDRERIQANDVSVQNGNMDKLFHDIGWTPTISLERSLEDMLDYWRKTLAGKKGEKT